jgi:hypothetical protein
MVCFALLTYISVAAPPYPEAYLPDVRTGEEWTKEPIPHVPVDDTPTPLGSALIPTLTPSPVPTNMCWVRVPCTPPATPIPPDDDFPLDGKGIAYPMCISDTQIMPHIDWWYRPDPSPVDWPNVWEACLIKNQDYWWDVFYGDDEIRCDSNALLVLNEPDICCPEGQTGACDQGCTTPQEFVPLQLAIEDLVSDTMWIGSPATSAWVGSQNWLYTAYLEYLRTVDDAPHWDFLTVHIYIYSVVVNGVSYDNIEDMVDKTVFLYEFCQSLNSGYGICTEGLISTETGALAYQLSDGTYDYNAAMTAFDRYWFWPTYEDATTQQIWYNLYDAPLYTMLRGAAWYRDGDPAWGFPGATCAPYTNANCDVTQHISILGNYFLNLPINDAGGGATSFLHTARRSSIPSSKCTDLRCVLAEFERER